MAFDLLGIGTPAFLIPPLPRLDGAWVESLEVDAYGYLSEAALSAVKCIGHRQARRWMDEEFCRLASEIPYATANSTSNTLTKLVSYSTGGWSGAEEFISAVIGNFWLRAYLSSSSKGGHYTFTIPSGVTDA